MSRSIWCGIISIVFVITLMYSCIKRVGELQLIQVYEIL